MWRAADELAASCGRVKRAFLLQAGRQQARVVAHGHRAAPANYYRRGLSNFHHRTDLRLLYSSWAWHRYQAHMTLDPLKGNCNECQVCGANAMETSYGTRHSQRVPRAVVSYHQRVSRAVVSYGRSCSVRPSKCRSVRFRACEVRNVRFRKMRNAKCPVSRNAKCEMPQFRMRNFARFRRGKLMSRNGIGQWEVRSCPGGAKQRRRPVDALATAAAKWQQRDGHG